MALIVVAAIRRDSSSVHLGSEGQFVYSPDDAWANIERQWNDNDRGQPKDSEKIRSSTLFTTNSTCADMRANLELRGMPLLFQPQYHIVNALNYRNYLLLKLHYPDDGGKKHLCNVCRYLSDYMAQHPRRQPSSYLSPWEPDVAPYVIQLLMIAEVSLRVCV
jgi:hypothetical protein